MVPLSVALMQRCFGISEKMGSWRIIGLGLGFVGVAALLGTGPISGRWAGSVLPACCWQRLDMQSDP